MGYNVLVNKENFGLKILYENEKLHKISDMRNERIKWKNLVYKLRFLG